MRKGRSEVVEGNDKWKWEGKRYAVCAMRTWFGLTTRRVGFGRCVVDEEDQDFS